MSLRDEIAQVLDKHRMHHTNVVCLGCDWEALTADDPSFLNHQADAVIAHLALTEEWQTSGEVINWTDATEAAAAILVERFGNRTRRRYATPWEDA